MNYHEIRVDTARDILLQVCGVYTTTCSKEDFTVLHTNAPNRDMIQTLIHLDEACRVTPDGKPLSSEKIYFYSNSLDMIWILASDADRFYLLGPAFTDTFRVSDIVSRLDEKHLSSTITKQLTNFINITPVISALKMNQFGLMLYCALTNKTLSITDIIMLNIPKQQANCRITNEISSNYVLEQKLWQAVRDGNLHFCETLPNTVNNITPGYISDGKYLRQDKNLSIIQVALTCRAAVEGGLSPEIAYPLSDRYIQQIERCTNTSEVLDISIGVLDDYIRRVNQSKLQSGVSGQVLSCCAQISSHPEENVDLQQIAAKFGYTPYYFSRKFKQEMGISIKDYIAQQKINMAKQLLHQNTMTISEISDYLGFGSQSYFGSVFRKHTGMTPQEFQLKNIPATIVRQYKA